MMSGFEIGSYEIDELSKQADRLESACGNENNCQGDCFKNGNWCHKNPVLRELTPGAICALVVGRKTILNLG